MAALPRVGLIVTGGTIDSVGTDRLDLAWYIEAGKRLSDGELLGRIPELKDIAAMEEVPFRRLPSHALVDSNLDALMSAGLVVADDAGCFRYRPAASVLGRLCDELEESYRVRPVTVIRWISAPAERLQSLADAFKFRGGGK